MKLIEEEEDIPDIGNASSVQEFYYQTLSGLKHQFGCLTNAKNPLFLFVQRFAERMELVTKIGIPNLKSSMCNSLSRDMVDPCLKLLKTFPGRLKRFIYCRLCAHPQFRNCAMPKRQKIFNIVQDQFYSGNTEKLLDYQKPIVQDLLDNLGNKLRDEIQKTQLDSKQNTQARADFSDGSSSKSEDAGSEQRRLSR